VFSEGRFPRARLAQEQQVTVVKSNTQRGTGRLPLAALGGEFQAAHPGFLFRPPGRVQRDVDVLQPHSKPTLGRLHPAALKRQEAELTLDQRVQVGLLNLAFRWGHGKHQNNRPAVHVSHHAGQPPEQCACFILSRQFHERAVLLVGLRERVAESPQEAGKHGPVLSIYVEGLQQFVRHLLRRSLLHRQRRRDG
jgi:hypothetical protein